MFAGILLSVVLVDTPFYPRHSKTPQIIKPHILFFLNKCVILYIFMKYILLIWSVSIVEWIFSTMKWFKLEFTSTKELTTLECKMTILFLLTRLKIWHNITGKYQLVTNKVIASMLQFSGMHLRKYSFNECMSCSLSLVSSPPIYFGL